MQLKNIRFSIRKNCLIAIKYDQLSQLGETFCKTVNPLFKVDNYKKWYGWWKYDFERKMKRKGLK